MKKLVLVLVVVAILVACGAGAFAWYQWRGSAIVAAPEAPVVKEAPAAPEGLPPQPAAPEAKPTHRLPHLVDQNPPYADGGATGDEPVREFTLPLGPGGEVYTVPAMYRSYLSNYAADPITVLGGLDAAFTEAYSAELPAPRDGVRVHLHVGDFAQDYCGEVTLAYTLQTDATIAMLIGDKKAERELLADAPCEMKRTEEEGFCEQRTQCLNQFLSQKLKNASFDSPVLQAFEALQLQ